jgi:hypothetical protein
MNPDADFSESGIRAKSASFDGQRFARENSSDPGSFGAWKYPREILGADPAHAAERGPVAK